MMTSFHTTARTTTKVKISDPVPTPPVTLHRYLAASGTRTPDDSPRQDPVELPLMRSHGESVTDRCTDYCTTRSLAEKVVAIVLFAALIFPLPSAVSAAQEKTGTTIRVATFNTSLYRKTPNGLVQDLQRGTLTKNPNTQIATIAKIIRLVQPDIILLNEFDYDPEGVAIELFKKNYLEIEDNNSDDHPADRTDPIVFPYHFLAPSNTGVPSGVDFNNDAQADGKEDVFGYGAFPGQYGMAVLSKFPVARSKVKTFRKFLWRDMPDAAWPMVTTAGGGRQHYYSESARFVFRLSSKSHWDIPVNINDKTVHLLASHPTPPVFDGPEDRNGLRNHDEIRFWADYINTADDNYIYDDNGVPGGLPENHRFIVLGDLNASPSGGESSGNPILMLLEHSAINNSFVPRRRADASTATATATAGGTDKKLIQIPQSESAGEHTTDWGLRVDYVLPSRFGFRITDGGVFWPSVSDPYSKQISGKRAASDHRLVWLDLMLLNAQVTD
jgi:endonuclease/exonuclease/phosphatase family metal-dependent hydrolase